MALFCLPFSRSFAIRTKAFEVKWFSKQSFLLLMNLSGINDILLWAILFPEIHETNHNYQKLWAKCRVKHLTEIVWGMARKFLQWSHWSAAITSWLKSAVQILTITTWPTGTQFGSLVDVWQHVSHTPKATSEDMFHWHFQMWQKTASYCTAAKANYFEKDNSI